jgi:hypothetical protein
MSENTERTKWGRTKFGSGRRSAMAIAIPCGLLVGIAMGVVGAMSGLTGPAPWLGAVVFALCLAVPVVLLVWVIIVDRSTLQGAAKDPEESIESRWYTQAAAGAQTDVILAASLGAFVLTLMPGSGQIDARLVLLGVIAASFLSFSLRYQLLRRKA